jgi:hypothetical protein
MIAVYAIVNGNAAGWASAQTLVTFGSAVVLLGLFIGIESRVSEPLLPLGLLRLRNLGAANIAAALWAAALFAWFVHSALYLQLVLRYTPLQVGLAFLPATLIMAAFSLGLSATVVIRFGIKAPLVAGLLLAATGLSLLGLAPVSGNLTADVLPGMLLFGVGAGMASTPLLLAAMSGVAPSESGVASGVVNTTLTMGGAFGLAIVTSVAAARTQDLLASGNAWPIALTGGYHAAFFTGAGFSAMAASFSAVLLRTEVRASQSERDQGAAELTKIDDD